MDIVLRVGWHVEVDDQLNIIDVDAAREDVCSHDDTGVTVPEAVHHLIALLLAQVRVHLLDRVPLHTQHASRLLDPLLRCEEDDAPLRSPLIEQRYQ